MASLERAPIPPTASSRGPPTVALTRCLAARAAVSDAGRVASRDFAKWRAEKQRIEQSALIRKKRVREPLAQNSR